MSSTGISPGPDAFERDDASQEHDTDHDTEIPPGSVVVGIDGSPAAQAALAWAVAEALGTTQQALLAASAPGGEAPAVAGERAGVSHLLLHDPDGVDVTEFAGVSETWGEFFTHGRRELLYVVRGRFEVELDEPSGRRRVVLGERDSLS